MTVQTALRICLRGPGKKSGKVNDCVTVTLYTVRFSVHLHIVDDCYQLTFTFRSTPTHHPNRRQSAIRWFPVIQQVHASNEHRYNVPTVKLAHSMRMTVGHIMSDPRTTQIEHRIYNNVSCFYNSNLLFACLCCPHPCIVRSPLLADIK